MAKLEGKVAVVTGASKGIGAGIAKALAGAGASVVVNYASSRSGADATVAAITAAGGKAVAIGGSVASGEEVTQLFAQAREAYGRVDILVNNAGVYKPMPLSELSEAEYRRHFDTNVLGLLLASQAAAAQFGAEGGSIINIGSVVSRLTPPGMSVYNATKGAVDAITRTLAKELGGRGIRVNAINPGATATEGAEAAGMMSEEALAQVAGQTPLGRIGQPVDIAPLAVFLASAEAAWITGETIAASGGL